jgi:hypothetical protein
MSTQKDKQAGSCFALWRLQSEDVAITDSHQTTEFEDQVQAPLVKPITTVHDIDWDDPTSSSDLQSFLKRPVRIYTGSWSTSSGAGDEFTLYPWQLFLNTLAIKNKLQNYTYLRGNLHVKVMMNASPFYYGAMLVNYTPMESFHQRTLERTNNLYFIPESQKPGVFIYPQENVGAELSLPFYYHKNFLDISSNSDVQNFGTLKGIRYTPLRSANGASGVGATYQIYAWMDDVVLAGPTTKLVLQSKDEYGNGPVSGPASTLARLAGLLKSVPLIGPYATATEVGARAVSGIAQIFGFTNVPVIDPAAPIMAQPTPQLASAQIGHVVQKMTIDPKNELTVDNGAVGFSNADELAIESFCTRQSYLTKTTWTTTSLANADLFTTSVNPAMMDVFTDVKSTRIAFTPMGLCSRMFRHWRGDIIFTFRVVSSKYHKGRLQVAFDPAVNPPVQAASDLGPLVQNVIYDLGQAQEEFEFRVPYSAATSWLRRNNTVGPRWATNGTLITSTSEDNGLLTLRVLTPLTAPVSTSSVDILISVRGAENIEFSNPDSSNMQLTSQWNVQSQDERMPGVEDSIIATGGDTTEIISARNRVYMGEQVRTLRHLLRRFSYIDFVNLLGVGSGLVYGTFTRFPPSFGPETRGIHSAAIGAGATVPFNLTTVTPYHLITSCFLGQRGSTQWVITSRSLDCADVRATRVGTGIATVTPWSLISGVSSSVAQWRNIIDSSSGSAIMNSNNSNGLVISVPDMSGYKFHSTAPGMGTYVATDPASDMESIALSTNSTIVTDGSKGGFNRYFAVGTDFNVVYFMYVPLMSRVDQAIT